MTEKEKLMKSYEDLTAEEIRKRQINQSFPQVTS